MPDSVALIISSENAEQVSTALDLMEAAAMMEMTVHVYFTNGAVCWLKPDADGRPPADDDRGNVLARLREIRQEGDVKVYACSRAMARHGLSREALPAEVDQTAGFAFFLGLASEASVTVNF